MLIFISKDTLLLLLLLCNTTHISQRCLCGIRSKGKLLLENRITVRRIVNAKISKFHTEDQEEEFALTLHVLVQTPCSVMSTHGVFYK